ncbi:MAG: FAD-binding oxidoreductase [Chloroflexota bacterium]
MLNASIKTTPFWTDQFPRPHDLPTDTALPSEVDVAIVGSGYTGLNAARVLAKNNTKVAVLERNHIGWGASSRNGGMATPGIKQSVTKLLQNYGQKVGTELWQASLDAIDLIDEVVLEEGLDCDWVRNGHVGLAYKASHFEKMKKSVGWYKNTLNHTYTLVTPETLRTEIGTDTFYGGLADDYSGGLQPAKYVFGLARAVARHGAHLCENTDVTGITKEANGFRLHTSQGPLQAKEVLIATNGYTDRLVPKLKRQVFPVGSYIIVTEPLSEDLQQDVSPKGRMFYDSKNFLNYFRLTPDGRMLWGGRNDLSTDLDLLDSAQRLHAQMTHVFPQLDDIPITHSWTGQLGITFDLMPHIGQMEGIHYAFGYGGHGLSIATYIGTEMGLLLSGEKTRSPFLEIPQQTMFFYRNKPWFLPLAAQYFRVLDKVS